VADTFAPAPVADPATGTTTTEPARRGRLGPGWWPAAAVLVATAATLHYYGVGGAAIVAFYAYTALAITLPGTLLWRLLMRGAGHIGTDSAAGTAVGFAVEIPVYLAARAAGQPYAVAVWPVITLVTFAAVPGLRRFWRGSGDRMPGAAGCAAGIAMLYVLADSALTVFRVEALTGHLARAPYPDEPFQTALVGELKHHFPAVMPYVTGTPLQYHWYVHAHTAAASWLTGIEPQVLLLRLVPLPMMYASVLLVIAIARALTQRVWPGLVAVAITFFATMTSPYRDLSVPFATGSLLDAGWYSPTQTFGAMLFAALILVLVRLLRAEAPAGPGPWIAFALLSGAVAGAKATFLPMLACGLALAVLVRYLRGRRAGGPSAHRTGPELGALAISLVWLVFAQLGLYGGGDQGMAIAPLSVVKFSAAGQAVLGTPVAADPWPTLVVFALLTVLSWVGGLAGAIGLARSQQRWDCAYWIIVGIGISGAGALFAFGHPGLSELYFIRSAEPYLAIAAACGLAALVRGVRSKRAAGLWAGSFVIGVALVYAVRAAAGASPRSISSSLVPYAVLAAALLLVGATLVVLGRGAGLSRAAITAAVVLVALGTTVPAGLLQPTDLVTTATTGPERNVRGFIDLTPAGGIPAARWLRDHSSPDDLVATNDHCLAVAGPECDSRDFWLAAYAERRVLVEGWAYTDRAMDEIPIYAPGVGYPAYWDPALLAANDAVFTAPDRDSVHRFAHRYGVRWLVAVGPHVDPALADFATLRFTAGEVSIYQL
jgi:hypothetical protein